MSEAYWKAKIWGLLHDPALKALHNNKGRGEEGCWEILDIMKGWRSPKETQRAIADADLIASASDRSAIGSLCHSVDYKETGLEITHLLSGEKISNWKLPEVKHRELISLNSQQRKEYLENHEQELIPDFIKNEEDGRKVFWWLWRCLPEAVCKSFGDDSLILMPAETRLPDGSIWSHTSLTGALAGAIAGYEDSRYNSRPFLVTFSFSPVQELIKASRKMRDFWAGSWILHYLSAKICWKLANIYGPDIFIYPSLYGQPLIDKWLLEQWSDFDLSSPSDRQLLTAGFPNVLVMVLPKEQVLAAMQTATTTLKEEWRKLSKQVWKDLNPENSSWMPDLKLDSRTWEGWLKSQWQPYWVAVPIGKEEIELKDTGILRNKESNTDPWVDSQNEAYGLQANIEQALFIEAELEFLRATFGCKKPGVNVGSWWAAIFDQTRLSLTAIKNARNWIIPTAFGPRSTISGIGPVVHPDNINEKKDWITEGETRKFWKQQVGLFDGIEELNATETLKRGLHRILPEVLNLDEKEIAAAYPDLTAGAAGYLKINDSKHWENFDKACFAISQEFPDAKEIMYQMRGKWGIHWADKQPQKYHPRLLNAGWLIEDTKATEERDKLRSEVQKIINKYYPQNNPTDWYVLAAGDGDGMSKWLKGEKMQPYYEYLPQSLQEYADRTSETNEVQQKFAKFVKLNKRMGPSTHNALSRALLDFSNQLVPYLTEQRYAGRLIYSGGDDVLAYTNLWEWDEWLWDIRQCFRGDEDPKNEFDNSGNYWKWDKSDRPKEISSRPLFTMGNKATISFGIIIAHHSVPLAIALENLWEAEEKAKDHLDETKKQEKDAVQIRVLYSNGNTLEATSKFEVFNQWQKLLNLELESAIFEVAATIWNQHPAPVIDAIAPWTKAFCSRREQLQGDNTQKFEQSLSTFLKTLWRTTQESDRHLEIQNWLKLAAFVIRNRYIKLGGTN